MSTEDPIILVDGSSYLYRAYHALPPLENSKNQPTGAIKGVISMIKKILIDHPDSDLAVVFDAKGKTFRHEMYPKYKANRPPMPEDLVMQIEPIHKIIELMGIKLIMISGVEADDVIGTLAEQARKKKLNTVISTGDKDMTQLVCDNVSVVNTMTGELLDESGVKNKFGVSPEYITDYLALIGDKSDNVPGVDKVELALSVADTVSLEQPVGEDGAQLGDFIQDEDASDPSLIVQDLDVAESLRDSISRLPEREGRILALRYGFYDGVPRTLEEIGEEFDLTRERIRQLEKLALCRLRHPSFGIREQDLV